MIRLIIGVWRTTMLSNNQIQKVIQKRMTMDNYGK